jgi:hypothetical protein
MAATKNNNKKTLALIGVTIVTLVLGGVAVITALRLRDLGVQPVAPTAPQSQPSAQDIGPGAEPICIVEFEVSPSACLGLCNSDSDCGTGYECIDTGTEGICYAADTCDYTEQDEECQCPSEEVVCQSKTAYLDVVDFTPEEYPLEDMTELSDYDQVSPGDIIVYAVVLNSSEETGTASFTDQLPVEVTLLDADPDYCVVEDDVTVTCDYDGDLPVTIAYRVQINDDVDPQVSFTNEVYVDSQLASCDATLQTSPLATPTPTSGPTPTNGPTSTPAPSSYPTTTPIATSTPVPTSPPTCGSSCTSSTVCGSGMECYQGVCRASACVEETDCICPVPTQPVLPDAGVTLPTIAFIAMGGIFILAGFIGFLVW